MQPRVILVGGQGLVGSEISKLNPNWEILRIGSQTDITNVNHCRELARDFAPQTIINLAAYTDVNRAEGFQADAWSLNVIGAETCALMAHEVDAHLIHVSSDYVFNHPKERLIKEGMGHNPVNFYGLTKSEGELRVKGMYWNMQYGDRELRHTIIRPSWVFGTKRDGFPEKIIKATIQAQHSINVITDEVGTPTRAFDLAVAIKKLQEEGEQFPFPDREVNFCNSGGSCSRYKWAYVIIRAAHDLTKDPRLNTDKLDECLSNNFARPAKRPENSALDNSLWQREVYAVDTWMEATEKHIWELFQNGKLHQLLQG